MRILRHPVSSPPHHAIDPGAVFRALYAAEPNAFWLDSGPDASTGRTFLGAGSEIVTTGVLDRLFAQSRVPHVDVPLPLGFVGWLGYGLGPCTTGIEVPIDSGSDSAIMRVDRIIAVDHATGVVELVALGEEWSGELADWRAATLDALDAIRATGPRAAVPVVRGRTAIWADTDAEYLEKIAECQRAIRDGEAYQLCLTTRVTVDTRPDPLETYLTLRSISPTAHGGLIRIGDTALLSASPEQFLTVSIDGIVETRPIKGTRPRGVTPEEDVRLADQLRADPKERAENLMIVDLMRNDLGRVCTAGSVSVPALFSIESYAQVHQLVSTVRGSLAAGRHPVDVLTSCFPAGSMTGAPKLRAIELLDRIEGRARGTYSGAFGWIGDDGSIALSMVIRSIVLTPEGASIGTGGGITSSSVPERELAEVKLKARALLQVLGAD